MLIHEDEPTHNGQKPMESSSGSEVVDWCCDVHTYVFGYNQYGQLGLGPTDNLSTPQPLRFDTLSIPEFEEGVGEIVQASAGTFHTLMLTDHGLALGFGDGQYGQMGNGSAKTQKVPRVISALSEFVVAQVCAGAYHSVVLTDSGDVYTFGTGLYGRLGHGNEMTQDLPVKVRALEQLVITQVAAGQHTMALTDRGDLYTFGFGELGQLGIGESKNMNLPTKVDWEFAPILHIYAGSTFSVVVTEDGGLYTFGCGKDGKLGHGSVECELRPRRVENLAHQRVVQVGAGGCHTMALTDDGAVYTAGSNLHGQLGHGSYVSENIFRRVAGLKKEFIADVSAGDWHSAVITASGSVYCFGHSAYGQVGIGKKHDEPLPVRLTNLEHEIVSKIATGYSHTIILAGEATRSTYTQDMFRLIEQPIRRILQIN